MAYLLDLSDEVLLEVVSYLQIVPPPPNGYPFYLLPRYFKDHNRTERSKAANLNSLARCCRRLRRLTFRFLYSYLPLVTRTDQHCSSDDDLRSLDFLLDSPFDLARFITQVHLDGEYAGDFCNLFGLPNIHTLCISNWKDEQPLQWEDPDYERSLKGFSPIRNLHITCCSAGAKPLTQILSWPGNLTHLFLEVDTIRRPISRTLQPHLSTLRQLTLTHYRHTRGGEKHFEVDHLLDFRDFTALISLRVAAEFYLSWEDNYSTVSRLPRMLEEFEIVYQYDWFMEFLPGLRAQPFRSSWVSHLLRHKTEGTSVIGLKRMRFVSQEWRDEDSYVHDSATAGVGIETMDGIGLPDSSWRPSKEFMDAFLEAGVSFSIFIHPRRRYRYLVPGEDWFEDTWEGVWNEE